MGTDVTYHRATTRAGLLLRIAFLSALATLVIASPSHAADPKPDAIIKNRTIEARVLLDDQIKADPALAADCLAEGKKWLEKNAADAAASRKQDPQFFQNGGWDFERKYTIRSVVADRYVSLIRADYMDTHGAHPNSGVDTILWDKAQAKRISIRPFFTETADNGATMKALQKAVIASLRIEKKKRDAGETATNEWFKGVEPSLLKIGAVTLAPSTEAGKSSGLTFHYPPYAVGPYAEGEYVAFASWETLKPYLTPEGARIFGGMRPKGDEDDGQ
ncbi:RsiV family protein [Bradyrhizobium sp. Ec3.3]|uniref:RsiV family protein n=1 Tax=Bradyrhizobium sp. Ec3.3 TaxID=189753 RepID=UPI000685ADA5|nr:RsiV family protein [Bradyrhizobium sp. Ec3.3]